MQGNNDTEQALQTQDQALKVDTDASMEEQTATESWISASFQRWKFVLLDIHLLSMDQKGKKVANTLDHMEYSCYLWIHIISCKYLYTCTRKFNISEL